MKNNKARFEEYIIKPVYLEREINYIVFQSSEYLCRLIPGEWGFEISPMDKAIGNKPDRNLIKRISDFIFQKNA